MKKYLLLIFASVLFVFEGSAQCDNGAGEIMLVDGYVCQNVPAIILSSPPINISTNFLVEWQASHDQVNWNFALGTGSYTNDHLELQTNNFLYFPTYFRKKITDLDATVPCNVIYSNVLIVNPIIVYPGQISGNDTVCVQGNNSAIISLQSGFVSNNPSSYSWEQSTGNNIFTPIDGVSSEIYTPSNLTVTTQYRREIRMVNSPCSGVSNTITKTVMNCGSFSSTITGETSITPNQTVTYSVPAQVGMQYVWIVIGGTIMSGQGTNTITVLWDSGANLRTSATNYSVSVKETDATPESKITTQEVTMQTATSINKSFAVAGISVFPNPFKDQFSIVMSQSNTAVTYTVYSTTGVDMQSGSFTSSTSGTSIQTSLPAGIYQLVLNYDGVFTSTRLAVY